MLDTEVIGYSNIVVLSGTEVGNKDFGNFQWLTICGVKFRDNNGNGAWDGSDAG